MRDRDRATGPRRYRRGQFSRHPRGRSAPRLLPIHRRRRRPPRRQGRRPANDRRDPSRRPYRPRRLYPSQVQSRRPGGICAAAPVAGRGRRGRRTLRARRAAWPGPPHRRRPRSRGRQRTLQPITSGFAKPKRCSSQRSTSTAASSSWAAPTWSSPRRSPPTTQIPSAAVSPGGEGLFMVAVGVRDGARRRRLSARRRRQVHGPHRAGRSATQLPQPQARPRSATAARRSPNFRGNAATPPNKAFARHNRFDASLRPRSSAVGAASKPGGRSPCSRSPLCPRNRPQKPAPRATARSA